MTLVVNGRFLHARPTGVQRVARRLLEASRRVMPLDVVAPVGVRDPLVDRHTWAPPGRWGGQAWEQVRLPVAAAGRPVVSLANTAPLVLRRAAVMVHDLATLVGPQWFRRDMRLYGRLSLHTARRAAVVLTVSESIAAELADTGIAPSSIRIVRPTVDPMFDPAPDAEVRAGRRLFGLTRDYVVHVGWADPRKDVETLVRAHHRVLSSWPHDLVLVGDPHPNFAPVRVSSAPSVRLVGAVTDQELRALLTGAAAFAFPSRYEGFGLPPLEAVACGTPALVSDIPALRESAGRVATLIPVGDADAWASGLRAALDGDLVAPPLERRTWQDAAGELQAALAGLADAAGIRS